MADQQIEDLGELTALAAGDQFLVNDVSDTTDDVNGSPKKILASTMGGLVPNPQTITTADVTGAVGQLYICTIAGLTANRNLTLPSAAVGSRIGVKILDGDATYALIIKGAASQTIDGGSAEAEWNRMFIAGEYAEFVCTAANTWYAVRSDLIPCSSMMLLTTGAASEPISSIVLPTSYSGVWTSAYDIGSVSTTATGRFTIRRAGNYSISMTGYNATAIGDASSYAILLGKGATPSYLGNASGSASGSQSYGLSLTQCHNASVDDYFQYYFNSSQGSRGLLGLASPRTYCSFSIREIM